MAHRIKHSIIISYMTYTKKNKRQKASLYDAAGRNKG